jgi:hypothetical protein
MHGSWWRRFRKSDKGIEVRHFSPLFAASYPLEDIFTYSKLLEKNIWVKLSKKLGDKISKQKNTSN